MEENRPALRRLSSDERDVDEAVEAALGGAVKKASWRLWKRRPVVETTVLWV